MSEYIDPAQFVITRKRKKYKFAKFHNAENCYEFGEWTSRPVDIVEIGAGDGRFSVELAARHPEQHVVALDVKADRLQKGAYDAIEQTLTNIVFVRARADQINELFAPSSISTIWLTFSDPFPRARSAGRRLTHPSFLRKYAAVLRPRGRLLIKHDNPDFFQWTLEQLVAEKWQINEISFDLHESELNDEYKLLTGYEQRWLSEGRTSMFVAATPSNVQ
ncbi:tRNA (guanosine(46)-N7)-methyltransferase TrmB [Candidatus Saccharibacteria bacterium]|nr:tRNA (guanosine(46)-N7)-methyltransferase TrmB [Candidatus Saccharibacteria bacterium]